MYLSLSVPEASLEFCPTRHHYENPRADLNCARLILAEDAADQNAFQGPVSYCSCNVCSSFQPTLRQNPRVFLEDAWKTPGRHGHLSHNSPEDTDPKKNIINNYYSFSDPCLLGNFARGVHVFQASSRRLPGKHECFC